MRNSPNVSERVVRRSLVKGNEDAGYEGASSRPLAKGNKWFDVITLELRVHFVSSQFRPSREVCFENSYDVRGSERSMLES